MLLAVLDESTTPIGHLRLLKRLDLMRRQVVHEIQLDDCVLMTSAAAASEELLTDHGLAAMAPRQDLSVVVGGLGLGHTAARVLQSQAVRELLVIELLPQVLDWHHQGLVPLAATLNQDARCKLQQGDFFALARDPQGFHREQPGRRFDLVLLDIDHSPDALLDPGNDAFYQPEGLRCLPQQLEPGGLFAMWSSGPPLPDFVARLQQIFASAGATVVEGDPDSRTTPAVPRTLYLARSGQSAAD